MVNDEQRRQLRISAIRLMHGDEKAADRWLNSPKAIFGEKTPNEHAETPEGIRDVEQLISRLEHGVFS